MASRMALGQALFDRTRAQLEAREEHGQKWMDELMARGRANVAVQMAEETEADFDEDLQGEFGDVSEETRAMLERDFFEHVS